MKICRQPGTSPTGIGCPDGECVAVADGVTGGSLSMDEYVAGEPGNSNRSVAAASRRARFQ
ncbi:hypothetical protein Ahu01nite_001060 [Winogradskya humida]|uniref:Uncharacterized protein n=1 Tax=Winogradskya humida TaxID=113566 RepID=A0ABQ3ZEM5_9ACTN|nr:hypothetical protein Ahu01nite_001060 [Actinoplanes humidus]